MLEWIILAFFTVAIIWQVAKAITKPMIRNVMNLVCIPIAFGISAILRLIHNYMHRRDKIATEQYYQTAEDYNLASIEDVIRKLANEHKAHDVGGEVIVPRRIIKFFENKYQSQKPLDYLCGIYLEEYLK